MPAGSGDGGGLTKCGRPSQIGVFPSSGHNLEVVNTAVVLKDAASFTDPGDAISSDLPGCTHPSAVLGLKEVDDCTKVSKEDVSNSNSGGKKGSPKKGQAFTSIDDEVNGGAQGTSDSKEAAVALSEGFSSDHKRLSTDLVGFESHKRGDPNNGSSWSLGDASSHKDEAAGKSIRFDTAVADTGFLGVEDAMDNDATATYGTNGFGAISVAEPFNDVAHRRNKNASDVAGNSKGVRCGSTLSGVAGHMGAFSATNCSENINHHGFEIGSGDVPPLCPFLKVVSSKQKDVLKAVTPAGFSATNCSENINQRGSLIGIGSGDFPPLCPSVKVVSSKQKDVVAERVIPAIAGFKETAGGQSKIKSSIGKDGIADGAGTWIHKRRPSREWVKTKSHAPGIGLRSNGSLPPTDSVVSSGVVVPAATVKQTVVEVGSIDVIRQSTPDLEGYAPSKPAPCLFDKNTHSEFPILGLGDDDFPPIGPLSVSGASIKTSKFMAGPEKLRTRSVVNPSLIPAYTQPQPVRMGSRTDKGFAGRGRGATAAILQSDDAKVNHNWRSLFVNGPKSCSTLAFYNPSTVDGKVTVNPPPEAVAEGVGIWEGSLVGQFFDKRLPLHVKSFVERLWGKHEIPEISTTDNGLYIFRFKDLVARDWVLDNGPWYFVGRPIILRFWKPGMEMLNVQITSLPIWVKFFNIPLEYWTVTSLGYIASVVGIPMHLDTLTENHSRLSFARICIEVDVNYTFPKSALLDLGNGKYSTIRIEYPWVPQNCAHCKTFDHSQVKCKGVKEKVQSGETTHLDHFDKGPAKDYIVDADSSPVSKAVNTADDIVNHITTPGKAGNVKVSDIQERLSGNTFECLSTCDDAGNQKVAVDTIAIATDTTTPNVISTLSGGGSLESPKLDLANIAEFSDTSPVCETFKQVKRIDELDYLPLSKKKLKKLRKQEHATKSANSSSRVDTISPYIVGID